MVRTNCAVYGCYATSKKNRELKFHRFPQDDRRQTWIAACQRPDLKHKTANQLYNMHVCSLHFTEWMYKNKKLKNAAIPILNLPPVFAESSEKTGAETIRIVEDSIRSGVKNDDVIAFNEDQACTKENTRRNKPICRVTTPQSKQVVYNIHQHYQKRKWDPKTWEYEFDLNINKYVGELTGLSERTVQSIVQRHRPSKHNAVTSGQAWIQACGNHKSWAPKRTSTVCSLHFNSSLFISLANNKRRLRDIAVPTLNLSDKTCSSSHETSSVNHAGSSGASPLFDAASDDSEQTLEMPVTVKIEVEEDEISEHDEDLMEQLENRKRLQEDSVAVDAKKIKVELVPTESEESQSRSQYEVEIEAQSQPQSSQFVGLQTPVQHKCVSQAPQPQVQLPDAEPIVVPEFFMNVVVRNQNEILSILKRQVLLQDPDPELLTFLRFLGSKLLRFPKNKREELQDKITEMLLLQ